MMIRIDVLKRLKAYGIVFGSVGVFFTILLNYPKVLLGGILVIVLIAAAETVYASMGEK